MNRNSFVNSYKIRYSLIPMGEFATQFGIDWKLFLSQVVNFLILLTILRLFVYKPVLKLLHDRKHKIEEGLEKAEEADRRLGEVQEIAKDRLKVADAESIALIRKAEEHAKAREAVLMAEAGKKQERLLGDARAAAEAERVQAREEFAREAGQMVRKAIERTVELSPAHIDESLIKKALKELNA